jgi:starch phosphorylase
MQRSAQKTVRARGSSGARAALSRSKTVSVKAVAAPEKGTMAGGSPASIVSEIEHKLKYQLGKTTPGSAHDVYQGAAWSAREHLVDAFESTHEHWR